MEIHALVEKSTGTRNIIGLLKDTVGLKRIDFNSVNWQNDDKLLFVDITKIDGSIHRVYCSKEVSRLLRAKTINQEHILGFPVVPQEKEDEAGVKSTRYFIQMPDGVSHKFGFDVSTLTVKDYVPAQVPWTELIG